MQTAITAMRTSMGATAEISTAIPAPTAKLAADTTAAWAGRGHRLLDDAELITDVAPERVRFRQLLGHASGERPIEATTFVDLGELIELVLRVTVELARLLFNVGELGVALRAHRAVFACGHGQRSGDDRCAPGHEHLRPARARRGHPDEEARGRHDAVLCPEDSGAQPADPVAAVGFTVGTARHGSSMTRGRPSYRRSPSPDG